MANKSHKKLRDLARLQSLYGNIAIPSAHSQQTDAKSSISLKTESDAGLIVGHHEVVGDLKYLGLVWLVMALLLGAISWLDLNTNLSQAIIQIGQRLVS